MTKDEILKVLNDILREKYMTKDEILKVLNDILRESELLYAANNNGAYEAGRIDGVKWCIKNIVREWK
jgi:predicted translin family RNA/ssDNA-binding protein